MFSHYAYTRDLTDDGGQSAIACFTQGVLRTHIISVIPLVIGNCWRSRSGQGAANLENCSCLQRGWNLFCLQYFGDDVHHHQLGLQLPSWQSIFNLWGRRIHYCAKLDHHGLDFVVQSKHFRGFDIVCCSGC